MKADSFLKTCADIQDAFVQAFQSRQFIDCGKKPLIPESDPSVHFVGASISAFKPFLTKHVSAGQDLKNMVLVQPCLRLHNLNSLLKTETLQYYSFFHMLGALCPPPSEKLAISALAELTGKLLTKGIIRASREQTPYHSVFADAFPVEIDTRPPEYYSWVFGTKEYTGKGVTLAFSNNNQNFWQFSVKDISKTGAAMRSENFGTGFQDVGNLIRLYDQNGRHIASEIGLGIETILQSKGNKAGLIESYPYRFLLADIRPDLSDHFIDSAVTSVVMAQAGVCDDSSKRGQLFNKAVRNMVYTGLIEGLDPDELAQTADILNHSLGGSSPHAETVRNIIEKQVNAAARNILHLEKALSQRSAPHQKSAQNKLTKKVMKLADGEYYVPDVVRDHLLKQNGLAAPDGTSKPYWPLDNLFAFVQSKPSPAAR